MLIIAIIPTMYALSRMIILRNQHWRAGETARWVQCRGENLRWWHTPFFLALRQKPGRSLLNLRLAWTIEQVPGQPDLNKETLSGKKPLRCKVINLHRKNRLPRTWLYHMSQTHIKIRGKASNLSWYLSNKNASCNVFFSYNKLWLSLLATIT